MDAVAGLLRQAEDSVRVLLGPAESGATRSWLGDGRCVVWEPSERPVDVRWAVDAELVDRPLPAHLARRYEATDAELFWRLWTAMEVACKLRDVPVAVWLREKGLAADPQIELTTFRTDSVVISCGALSCLSA